VGFFARPVLDAPPPLEVSPGDLLVDVVRLDARLRAHEAALADLYSVALEVQTRCPRAHLRAEQREARMHQVLSP
jgi:hypothetical protein